MSEIYYRECGMGRSNEWAHWHQIFTLLGSTRLRMSARVTILLNWTLTLIADAFARGEGLRIYTVAGDLRID